MLGGDEEKINKAIEQLLIFQTKQIIDMHSGLNEKEYTLFEIPKILNGYKLTEEDNKILEKEKEFAFLFNLSLHYDNWNVEKVRVEEANAIRLLKRFLLND